ncbi:RNA-binding S4 domain-containing protein [Symbiobacterium thermophilum]|uniref:RQC P-site tRNA stabilizing factor n=1 Tax=Symbiobacterium thermophilum TaxID=2734 RepID=A0A953IA95_SYMTR|nr:RNA-binding S4 domain-containing protein [Symbiobacterium thermophilum]MBY6276506.1 RNA-binding protein [Symbiobacterium thermophilum]
MRIDKFLKVSRIIKRRTLAKEVCDAGRVQVGDKVAKAGTEVKPGDTISIDFGRRQLTVRVLAVREHVRAAEARELYEVIAEEFKADPLLADLEDDPE